MTQCRQKSHDAAQNLLLRKPSSSHFPHQASPEKGDHKSETAKNADAQTHTTDAIIGKSGRENGTAKNGTAKNFTSRCDGPQSENPPHQTSPVRKTLLI